MIHVIEPPGTFVDLSTVKAVIINYRTRDLTLRAVSTFRTVYPSVGVLLIDNGSGEESKDLIKIIQNEYPGVELVLNTVNIHHGPAMHQAMGLANTPLVLFLDSDCKVLHAGFIEILAVKLAEKRDAYAAGSLLYLNKRGFIVDKIHRNAIPYIHPYCMLVKRELYMKLLPFELHGAPVLQNMRGAVEKGFLLINVMLDEYVHHDGRGTAGRFGYGLGIKGRLNYLLNLFGL